MNTKSILIFCAGMLIGGVAGVFGSMEYYKKKFDSERDELEDYYHEVDKYARRTHEDEDEDVNPVETDSKVGGRMSPEERREIREKLRENWAGTTNYAKMYKSKDGSVAEEDPSESLCKKCSKWQTGEGEDGAAFCDDQRAEFLSADGCDGFTPYEDGEEEQMFDEYQKNKNKPPKIISADAYSNLPSNIEQEVLYFYAHDEVVADDNDEFVEDPERLLGNCLTKYDFIDSEERIIFVMNYELSTCYEVQKVDAAWSDSH